MRKQIAKLMLLVLFVLSVGVLSSCKKKADTAEQTDAVKETDSAVQVAAEETEAGLVPLQIDYPKPMFVGTPQNISVPNLEEPKEGDRPDFLVPEGVVNLAAGKLVMSSDEEPIIGEIEMITDGDKEAADGSYVELGPFLQDITIDLEQECEIYAVVVWHFHKQARVYKDIVVQLSNDPDFIMDPITIYNNDHDNSAGLGVGEDMHYVETFEGRLINAKGNQARYVRLYSNGNTFNELNHYIEVEVYGKPVE